VRTQAVGLCHSDLHVIDGSLVRPRPIVLGHEAAGVVEAVGPDVTSVSVGASVVTCLVMPCGACARCRAGEEHLCADPAATLRGGDGRARLELDGTPVAQMAGIGALGERIIVDERAVVAVPSRVPSELAAVLGCAIVTGLGAVLNVANVRPGERVAVIGCGGIGLAIVQGARIAGAGEIAAIDIADTKLELARQLGATSLATAADLDAVQTVTGTIDHAFEAVGRPATMELAVELAAPGRSAYAVGILPEGSAVTLPAKALRRGKRLVGVFMGSTRPQRDIPRYVELWERGDLDLASMVSDQLPLEAVNDGFAALARGEVARAVVRFDA
jgi:S-(hydroxymethyl)glutathione dehydrogenase/alcohol dehydrogenase